MCALVFVRDRMRTPSRISEMAVVRWKRPPERLFAAVVRPECKLQRCSRWTLLRSRSAPLNIALQGYSDVRKGDASTGLYRPKACVFTTQVPVLPHPLPCPCPIPAPHMQCALQIALIISWPARPSAHPRVQARRMVPNLTSGALRSSADQIHHGQGREEERR